MAKLITAFTTQELEEKIAAIKAEREETANTLKCYEEELEHRKKEVPLGVPIGDAILRSFIQWFQSKESADKFDNDYLTNCVQALQDIAEGKPIDIEVLKPFLRKGWVAMFESGVWCWFAEKPKVKHNLWEVESVSRWKHLNTFFNIKPAEDWIKSLQECGI